MATATPSPKLEAKLAARGNSTALRRSGATRPVGKTRPTRSKQLQVGVRSEKIAKAKALINDPNYPSGRVMESVARRLAKEWRNKG